MPRITHVATLLLCSIAGVIASANVVYNVTETSHTETTITGRLKDANSKAVYEDYITLQDWFVAPRLLPIIVAASDKIRTPRCRKQSRLYLQELRNFTLWAAQSE
jgi:hypothetical protein